MSVLSPKVRLVQNPLNDVLSVAMFLASAERTQHKDQLIGHDLEFHRRLTSGYRKGYELAAAAIDPTFVAVTCRRTVGMDLSKAVILIT